jgi:hypothetical protein
VTILDERPTTAPDAAELAAEVEAFITHPAPYEIGDARAVLRGDVRTAALANLLGALTDLIGSDAITTDAVTAAIRAAIASGTKFQQRCLADRGYAA